MKTLRLPRRNVFILFVCLFVEITQKIVEECSWNLCEGSEGVAIGQCCEQWSRLDLSVDLRFDLDPGILF